MDIKSINKPIAAVCLCAILILIGIGIFIPNYSESYTCELVVLRHYQIESVSIKGMNSFTISGTYHGDLSDLSSEILEAYKDTLNFLLKDGSVAGEISDIGFIGGPDGDTHFYISGNSRRLLLPGKVTGIRLAGKSVEFDT